MANNLENNLIIAHSAHVSIAEHRSEYTAHYNALRKEIYSQWKDHETLGKLVNGYTLGGGYGDKIKVGMPDEFDLVIHLKFPENDKIVVTADRCRPGNVILDMTKVMQILATQEQNKTVFQLLQKIVNHKQQLLEDKLQGMLQGLMTQILLSMGNQIEVNGEVSPIKYKRCGPAHTIEVKGRYVYSVDFVPAIKLAAAQNVLAPEQRVHFGDTPSWDAIPKPIKPPQPGNVSFRASYYEAEKKLIYGKNNLKNAIRLLKQYRNTKNNMSNLKSYFIKTLFLWEVIKQHASYWHKPNSELLIEMLTKLADVLSLSAAKGKGKLLFFWDPKLDMIADLDSNQRRDLFNCVIGAQAYFRRADGNLTDDIKNGLSNWFSNGDKDKGLENKPLNGQQVSKAKEKTPPAPNEPKNKPKAKAAETVQIKPNPKPNEPKKNGGAQTQPKVKAEPSLQVKPNPKPNEPKKNGGAPTEAKPKVKAEPSLQVKPNPKPNEQPKGVKANPNQNQPKAAKGVTPSPVQPNQPKKGQPEAKTNPNAKANVQPTSQPQARPKANAQPNVQPQPKAKASVQPNSQPQPKVNPNQNGGAKPQPETSPKQDKSNCLIN